MTTITELLTQDLHLGDAQHSGALTVFPIFSGEPALEYLSFADAQASGATVGELPGGASVNDLIVTNPTALPVLLYDGEEVAGAQQNRTFDVSVLVAAGSKLQVPVSCVEAGRWDGSRHGESFKSAPQAAYPSLRRSKNLAVRNRAMAGADARADQGEVWEQIAEMGDRMKVESDTGAMHDVFERHRDRLDEMCSAIERQDRQVGALVANGERSVVDLVSRSDVWAALHGPLIQGYALDAIDATPTEAPPVESSDVGHWLETILGSQPIRRPAVGEGTQLHFQNAACAGGGLEHEGELIQLSAFRTEQQATRIGRPSRRR